MRPTGGTYEFWRFVFVQKELEKLENTAIEYPLMQPGASSNLEGVKDKIKSAMAVRFQYEYHDLHGQWFRAYGNELWEFDDQGLMHRREASINDVSMNERERRFHWPAPGPRPADDDGIPCIR